MGTVDHYRDIARATYGDRRWVLAFDVLAGTTGLCAQLQRLGVPEVVVIAATHGAGPTPDPTFAVQQHVLGVTGDTMMDGIRRGLAALAAVPDDVRAAVDGWDPDGRARVLGTIFDVGTAVVGRAKFGARRPEWVALEDKIAIEDLWRALDVPRAPHRVVPVADRPLRDAHAALDQGLGTVWAGDNREGWHGGAQFLRWVRSADDHDAARSFFAEHCDRLRVMPFVEGIPCSVHGIVFPDHVVVLRPCEMVVLRRRGEASLQYARAATFWDPPDADRAAMRALARRVGVHLRSTLGYRGAFTIDGILGADGFVPTELNPRYGAALGILSSSLSELPLMLLNLAVVEGVDADWRPRALERLLLDAADGHRAGSVGVVTPARGIPNDRVGFVQDGDGWRPASDDEPPHARAMVGPAAAGTYCAARFVPEHTPVGPSLAPRAAAVLAAMNDHWGLGLPALEPPRDVRRDVTPPHEGPR